MRTSPRRHPLAVLRLALGLTQKELAAVLDCSTIAVQRIELGSLPLSATMLQRVVEETDVLPSWLQKRDLKAPPVDRIGRPITRESFAVYQGKQPDYAPDEITLGMFYMNVAAQAATWYAAVVGNRKRAILTKMSDNRIALSKKFGYDSELLGASIDVGPRSTEEPREAFRAFLKLFESKFDQHLAAVAKSGSARPSPSRLPAPRKTKP